MIQQQQVNKTITTTNKQLTYYEIDSQNQNISN